MNNMMNYTLFFISLSTFPLLGNGFGTMLLKEVLKHIDKPYTTIPEIRNKERVVHIFKKEGVEILN